MPELARTPSTTASGKATVRVVVIPPSSGLSSRHNPEKLSVVLVRQHIQRFVRALADVANAPTHLLEQSLLEHDAIVLQVQADEMLAEQRSEQQVALPFRKQCTVIERQ